MKKGFTLAEILVTIAIIGVVAALTISVTMKNIQKQILYNQFMYAYSTFARGFQLLYTDGEIISSFYASNKGSTADKGAADKLFESLLSHLRYSVKCKKGDYKCFHTNNENKSYKNLSKTQESNNIYMFLQKPIYSLPNGTDFSYVYHGITKDPKDPRPDFNYELIKVVVDVNGIEKGPNIIGRDVFVFSFLPFTQTVIPSDWQVFKQVTIDLLDKKSSPEIDNEKVKDFCDPKNNDKNSGVSCGLRLLREKKMDY